MLTIRDIVCQQINKCFELLDMAQTDDERLYLLDEMDRYVDTIRIEIVMRREALEELGEKEGGRKLETRKRQNS